jgi:AcrR family transcriptional regulator
VAESALQPARPAARRDQLRAATILDIKHSARRLLREQGPAAISLRAIARDLGMTAPALYRYFVSLDDLVSALVADAYTELTAHVRTAADDAGESAGERLTAAVRAFRDWALANTPEFSLIFGTPLPGVNVPPEGEAEAACAGFGQFFAGLFTALWQQSPFPVAGDDEIDERLAVQLREYGKNLGAHLPLGALALFLSCWVRLYGLITLEAFGHVSFALSDPEAMFESELRQMALQLGIR